MTRTEVEDLASASLECAAAAEYLAAAEPADEQKLVRRRDHKMLAIGLLMRQHDLFADALHDRVALVDDPQDLTVAGFTPLQCAGVRAAELLEDLGGVTGVEHHKAHAVHHAAVYLFHHRIRYLAVRHMSPPEQHVRFVQHLVGQSGFRHIQGRGGGIKAGLGQEFRDAGVDAVRVDRTDILIYLFVSVLVPNCDFHKKSPLQIVELSGGSLESDPASHFRGQQDRIQHTGVLISVRDPCVLAVILAGKQIRERLHL